MKIHLWISQSRGTKCGLGYRSSSVTVAKKSHVTCVRCVPEKLSGEMMKVGQKVWVPGIIEYIEGPGTRVKIYDATSQRWDYTYPSAACLRVRFPSKIIK